MKNNIKKIIIINIIAILILIIGFIIYNNIKRSYKVEDIVEEKYLLLVSNEYKGVIDNKGNIIIEPKYYDVQIPNPAKAIFICQYDYNSEADTYRSKVINENETEIFTKYNNLQAIQLNDIQTSMPYEKNVLKYEKDGKFGLIDLKGNEILSAKYDSIEGLSNKEGELLVSSDGKYGVINTKGAELIKPEYDYISGDGYYTSEKKYGLAGYVLGMKTNDGYRYGYMDYKMKKILDVEYNEIFRLGGIGSEDTDKNLILLAKKNGQYGLIKNKKVILDYRYQSIDYSGVENLFIVTRSSKYGVFDSTGEKIMAVKYDELEIKENYIYAKLDKEEAYFNLLGNRIDKSTIKENEEEEEEKDEKSETTQKLIPDEQDGKWGFIDENNNVIVDYIYDDATQLNTNGFAGIKLDGKWGSIDENGTVIIEPIYNLDSSYDISFIGKYYKVVYDYRTVYYTDAIN